MSEVKRGMLKFYHRGLLNKKWKEYKFILYESSLLTWYTDIKHKKPDGMVLLKDVERFICVGPYTRFLPDFPHLENEYDQIALIAFPQSIKDRDREIIWLLCEDVDDLNTWMKAIVQTLPSHTLRMERMANISSSSIDENIPSVSELNSPELHSPDRIAFKTGSVGLPLAAGLIGSRLQGHTMNSKEHPLQKAGYNYGDTLWGTGEGWGYFSGMDVPGYAAIGGSGCYSNHIDLIRNEDDEQRLKDVEDNLNETANDEETIEEATYELSKNETAHDEERTEKATYEYELSENETDNKEENQDSPNDHEEENEYNADLAEIEEDLHMIDSDNEK